MVIDSLKNDFFRYFFNLLVELIKSLTDRS